MRLRVARTTRPGGRHAAAAPVVERLGVFSAAECEAILALARTRPEVEAPSGYDPVALAPLDDRKGRVHWLPFAADTRWVYEAIDEVVHQANREVYGLPLTEIEPFQVSRYAPGDHFDVHADFGYLHATRHLTISVQLSDPFAYTGGRLQFLGASYAHEGQARASWDTLQGEAQIARGSVTVFPAYATHRVTPIVSGERFSLVGWVRGKPYA